MLDGGELDGQVRKHPTVANDGSTSLMNGQLLMSKRGLWFSPPIRASLRATEQACLFQVLSVYLKTFQ
jgi:hypothetical protein